MRKKSNELMGAKSRLLEFLEFKGIKKAEFYKQTGLSNGFLDKNNNISSDNIEIIISCYEELDLYWLITGKGEMIKISIPPLSMNTELLDLCKSLVANYQQRDDVMSKLVSIIQNV